MKKLKKPNRAQKAIIKANNINVENWMVERDTSEELVLVHRHTNTMRIIKK
jgi:hypothetical protein